MAALYGAGVAMGFSPEQVKAMSMWEFAAVANAASRQHAAGGTRLTETERAELADWILDDGEDRPVRLLAVYTHDEVTGRLVLARRVSFEG